MRSNGFVDMDKDVWDVRSELHRKMLLRQLDSAEVTLKFMLERDRLESMQPPADGRYGCDPDPQLTDPQPDPRTQRRPTPVGAIPSVFLEDETADLTDILVTGPDGEVL